MSFFGVHNHSAEGSNLRLRDSINKVPEMIEYAHSLGHAGICFTEHESITSSLDALKYYNSHKDLEGWENFKVVLGNEIYLCTEGHILCVGNRNTVGNPCGKCSCHVRI